MRTVLMVSEKPSLATSISELLSQKSARSHKGFNGACSVHEWTGQLFTETVRFKMTSVCGHVMTMDFPSKYNNWDTVDPADLFRVDTVKKEATPNLKMPAFLAKEARGCDVLVLWLDCDKEGENICFEVIDCVSESMRITDQNVYRAKFSAITSQEINHAMRNLIKPNKLEAMSVDARQELDLRIGCAFTRFQTRYFQGKYGNLDSTLISYGPCQTPTLGFCVDRHDKIQSFKPEAFWKIVVRVKPRELPPVTLDWKRIRVFERDVAQFFMNQVKKVEQAQVVDVKSTEKSKPRPQALNTVEMLRTASSGLGMGPHQTMQIAEKLYTSGFISYPRTETTHYPESFDLMGPLRAQQNHSEWGSQVKELLRAGISKPRKGSDAGDHPPITPMRAAGPSDLSGDMWRLYQFITTHFIATVMPDAKYLQTVVRIALGGEEFTCTARKVLDPGFTAVQPWLAVQEEDALSSVRAGDKLPVQDVNITEGHTSAPDYLTESELITLMEKHGIGTDASIPVHINNITERNYVQLLPGRKLQPTNLGIVLVHGYLQIDRELVLPHMRSAVEEQLGLIAAGKAQFDSVLRHAIDIFTAKFRFYVEHITGMDELFEVTFTPLAESGRPLSRCGKCRRYMKLVDTKPTRLHCSECNDTYSLPQSGIIKQHRELKCPLDDFELVLWTQGTNSKSYPLCPYCYSHPPFEDMRKGAGCNQCTHPTCAHSLNTNGVDGCASCQTGVLVLDSSAAPKYKILCNNCDLGIKVSGNITKMSVLQDDACATCNSNHVTIATNPKTPLEDGTFSFTGCIFCDSILTPLFEAKDIRFRRVQSGGARGRGRGRGRGGRGGGRGRGRARGRR